MQDIAVPAKTWIKSFSRVSTLTRCLSGLATLTQHCCNNDCDPLNAMNAECNPPSSDHQRCEADKKELEVFG